jgi:hypothetical protein
MPSPFPGMDPFLDSAPEFADFHNAMIIYLRDELNLKLPEGFRCLSARRIRIEETGRLFEPDVSIYRKFSPRPSVEQSNTAILELEETQPIEIEIEQISVVESYLEVFDRDREIVTVIEILSPANKKPSNPGHDEYKKKQREVLGTQCNLIEIDLVRSGVHTTAVPFTALVDRAKEFDYHICIHRAGQSERFQVYPFRIQDPFPIIRIPLRQGVSEPIIALKPLFDHSYESGRYDELLDYSKPELLRPALRPEQLTWVKTMLGELA